MNAVVQLDEPRAVVATTPAAMLMTAIERGADVGALEKLMDLNERWQREEARKAFHRARSEFQRLCPVITKDREVSYGGGGAQYKYATLPHIIAQVKDPLAQCGLTYRWEIADDRDVIRVTCILSHVDGHSEANSMSSLPDDSGKKNDIQQRGSAVSYLQRYTLIGVLGIASANEDDDGRASGQDNVAALMAHNTALRDYLESVYVLKLAIRDGNLSSAIEAWNEVDEEAKRALWLATTKGGIFTTEERRIMKSDEWGAERRAMLGAEK